MLVVAQGIEAEIQRCEQEHVAAEANIMNQEKEAEVKEWEAKVHEQKLAANIRKQAEAERYAQLQEAAITEMIVDKLPEIARAVAEPLTKVDKITMYGDGNASKMVGDIMQSID